MSVIMLCSFWTHAMTETADILLAGNPALRLVRYHTMVELDRGLESMSGQDHTDRLVILPEACEPDHIRTAWPVHAAAGVPVVMTIVPADLVLDGLTDETTLQAIGLHRSIHDNRAIGDLVAHQIEQADVVVHAGRYDGDDWENEQLDLILQRIAPWAEHRRLEDVTEPAAGRTGPVAPLIRGLHGRTVGVDHPLPDHGVVACIFQARRPFHPERLHDALDPLTDGVLRSRGHFWLASRPDLVMTWESAGGLSIGPVSGWLADLPDDQWDTVDEERSLAARAGWDPYYGDRDQHLAFIGVDLDAGFLHRTLTHCLLTDDELARGENTWRTLADPFRRAYPVPAVSAAQRADNQ